MQTLKVLTKPSIYALHPYQPGKPIKELQRELKTEIPIIKLASNENPLGPSPRALQAVQALLPESHLYPDGSGYLLKSALEKRFKVTAAQITLGNGSDNLINLLAQAFVKPNEEVLISEHGFLAFKIAALGVEGRVVEAKSKNWGSDLNALLSAITPLTRIIMIANPNNPTGTWVNHSEIYTFLKKVPSHILVLLDEAYYEYIAHEPSYPQSIPLLSEFENLVILRTFSKLYGLAGLRIGYSLSHPEIAGILNRIRLPFNVSALGLAAATAALNDTEHQEKSLKNNRESMSLLTQFCKKQGFEYIPSGGNFLTIHCQPPGDLIYENLLQEGIVVRPLLPYHMPHHLRISLGTEQELQRFTQAFLKVLSKKG